VAGRLDARGHKGEGLGGRAALRIEDYIATLPKGIVSGDGVQLPARALRSAPLRRTLSSLREGARVVSVWGPPAGCLPERIDFPFVLSVAPFREAKSVREQLLAVLGVRCVDFVTAWEYSERYTRAIGPDGNEGNRFLTMMQAVTMWIGARNLGVSCTSEMPESIRTYAGILRTFYGIEVEHLLEGGGESQPGPRGAAHAQ